MTSDTYFYKWRLTILAVTIGKCGFRAALQRVAFHELYMWWVAISLLVVLIGRDALVMRSHLESGKISSECDFGQSFSQFDIGKLGLNQNAMLLKFYHKSISGNIRHNAMLRNVVRMRHWEMFVTLSLWEKFNKIYVSLIFVTLW